MKKLNRKINELWQSRKKNMGEKGNLWMALLFGCIAFIFMFAFFNTSEFVDKLLFGYMMLVSFVGAITLVATYFYIYSKMKFSKLLEYVFRFLYKTLLCICFVVCIPVMVFLKIMEIMLRRRAKKLDNYEAWLIILVIDLMALIIFTKMNFFIARAIVFYVRTLISFEINAYPIKMFLMLALLKIEWDVINNLILRLMNHYGMAKIKKNISHKKSSLSNELPEDLDIKKYAEEKRQSLVNMEESKKKELQYDIAYQKATLWKFQLFCLIFLFLIATFADTLLFENQSDAINVITVFTLIMLYLDKRRAWDKDILGLET